MNNLKNKRIVLIRANTLRSDTRTIKMYETLREISNGYALLWNRDSIIETSPPADRLYINVPLGNKKIFFYLPLWFAWVVWRLIVLKPDAIHGCDIEGFLPGYFYTLFRRIPIIYDVHDVTTGRYGYPEGTLLWRLFHYLDHFSIKNSAATLLGDPERLEQMGLDINNPKHQSMIDKTIVIYNSEVIPNEKRVVTFKPGQRIRLSYVGAMNKKIRGVESLLKAVTDFPMIDFDIAGMGAHLDYFTEQFNGLRAKNLTFHGRIGHDKAMVLNDAADIMISQLDPDFENYRYATSTKIFEAMSLFKPMITTKGSVSGKVVTEVNWGEVIDFNYPSLKKVLTELTTTGKTYVLDGTKAQKYSWAKMPDRIRETYQNIFEN